MRKRDLKKDIAFMEMLSDEVLEKTEVDGVKKEKWVEKVKSNVIIRCYQCDSRDFNISGVDGTILICKECETTISISFVEREEKKETKNSRKMTEEENKNFKTIKLNGFTFCTGDIVECEAFRDVVVFRDGVLTTERNVSNQPLKIHKGLKVIGNIRDNPEMLEEMRAKQKEQTGEVIN